MSRWTQYDEDEYRLPEGMVRVGYDADTQQYTFRRGNELWLGQPGAQHGGELTRIGVVNDDDSEPGRTTGNNSGRSDGYQPLNTGNDTPSTRYANREIYPFILLIGLFLLLVWKFIVNGNDSSSGSTPHCPDGVTAPAYRVKQGDSCWEIANSHGFALELLLNQTLNPRLDCDRLKAGDVICLPTCPNLSKSPNRIIKPCEKYDIVIIQFPSEGRLAAIS